MTTRDAGEVIQIGKPVAKPIASILIPLYRNIGFIRFQLGALAEDFDCRRSEIIYVLDSPEQRNDVEHLLRGLHRLTELATTLVVMPRNLGYSAANNAGAQEARGPVLLFMNSDVVPMAPGWLAALLEPFSGLRWAPQGPSCCSRMDPFSTPVFISSAMRTISGSIAIITRACRDTGSMHKSVATFLGSPARRLRSDAKSSNRSAELPGLHNRRLRGLGSLPARSCRWPFDHLRA